MMETAVLRQTGAQRVCFVLRPTAQPVQGCAGHLLVLQAVQIE